MKKTIFIFALLVLIKVEAQENKNFIKASIGYGFTFTPYEGENEDFFADGFYIQGEYVYRISKWIDVRPYAGFITTKLKTSDDLDASIRLSTNAFLIGGKTRVKIPIKWVSPYIELGVGASIGSFETNTYNANIDESGLFFHVPFSLGLELGRKHNFDLAFTYYFHSEVEQFSSAFAFGFSFPLK